MHLAYLQQVFFLTQLALQGIFDEVLTCFKYVAQLSAVSPRCFVAQELLAFHCVSMNF